MVKNWQSRVKIPSNYVMSHQASKWSQGSRYKIYEKYNLAPAWKTVACIRSIIQISSHLGVIKSWAEVCGGWATIHNIQSIQEGTLSVSTYFLVISFTNYNASSVVWSIKILIVYTPQWFWFRCLTKLLDKTSPKALHNLQITQEYKHYRAINQNPVSKQ